jgi:hypothetical protein
MVTASSRTAPVIMNFTDEVRASRSMPFEIEPITSAPSSAAQTEPRPPNRLVPPMTAEAMEFSSRSLPADDWFTASKRDAARMPPQAAMKEARQKTIRRRVPDECQHAESPAQLVRQERVGQADNAPVGHVDGARAAQDVQQGALPPEEAGQGDHERPDVEAAEPEALQEADPDPDQERHADRHRRGLSVFDVQDGHNPGA